MSLTSLIPGAEWLPLLAQIAAKATLVLLLAAVVAALLWRASAATRHMVWCVAVLSVLALPVFSFVLPAWELPLLPATPAAAVAESPVADEAGDEWKMNEAVEPLQSTSAPAVTAEAGSSRVALSSVALAVAAGGVLLGALWLALGFWGVARLGRRAQVVRDPEWLRAAHDAAERLGLRRPVLLLRARGAVMPATGGIVWPSVVLPHTADAWPEDRRRAVLAHELAHVKRFDTLTQALAQVACVLFWWHPAVWYAARRLRVERERACDDLVLGSGTRASDYAAHLLEIARAHRGPRVAAAALVSMARPSQLESRLLWVLDGARTRAVPSARTTLLAVLAGLLIVGPLAAMRPTQGVAQAGARRAAREEARAPLPSFAPDEDEWTKEEGKEERALEGAKEKDGDVRRLPAFTEQDGDTIPTVEDLIALRSAGVDAKYIADMRAAGYADLTTRQLAALGHGGVTAEYAREMNALFGRLTPEQLASLGAMDVTPAYVAELRRHGYDGLSASAVANMAAVGVDGEYIQELAGVGYERLPAQQLANLRALDVTAAYVRELAAHGFTRLSASELGHLAGVGVTGEYIQQMRAMNLGQLDARALGDLAAMDVTPAYVRELAGVGLTGLTPRQLADLAAHDVTAAWIRELRAAGFAATLTPEQLVRLRVSDVDRELMESRHRERQKQR
ncbi:MAG TPA: M56 family metallopeptidase [Longimicrobium sp.]|nr:M56 family metallopeptidase [Longimicrobium sp.]